MKLPSLSAISTLRLRRRERLVVAMLTVQGLVMGLGGFLVLGAVGHRFLRTVPDDALHEVLATIGMSGLALLGVTLVGTVRVLRTYDSMLERANLFLEHEVERRTRQGMAIRNALIFGLAKLSDYRDTETGRHLERICQYSAVLAEELRGEFPEVTPAWIERLRIAASMHDIGKVGVPDSILLKPGPLTAREREVMQQHVTIGTDTLVAIRRRLGDDELLNMCIQVTLGHHEKYDGTGYPYALRGEQIPLAARIVALADVYDALTSRRVYKPAVSHEEASGMIREQSGKHFDPRVVAAFERVQMRFAAIRDELASTPDTRENFRLQAA